MKIEKLPSGSYRVRKMKNGKMLTATFDHKPTEMEIIEAIAYKQKMSIVKVGDETTVKDCILKYAEYKRTKNSPSTTREYIALPRRLSEAFLSTPISKVDQFTIDAEIMRLQGNGLARKTMLNYMSSVRTAINKFYPDLKINLEQLPEKEPSEEPYIPTKEEVKELLEYVNKNDIMFYVPIALAALCGVRRSELAAIKVSSIDDEYNLHILTAIVQDENNDWVEKGNKTFKSTRLVPIPKPLADRIKLQGYVYNGNINSIGKALKRIEKEMGLPEFSLHKLRHFYITELWENGLKEADILYLSGHSKASDINKVIYRHQRIKEDRERRQKLSDGITSDFF